VSTGSNCMHYRVYAKWFVACLFFGRSRVQNYFSRQKS
jgi:hypothetical protein